MDILEANMALYLLSTDHFPFTGLSIDLWHRVKQFDDIRSGAFGGGNIRNKLEGVSGLDSAECRTLLGHSQPYNGYMSRQITHNEADEELEYRGLAMGNEDGPIPEYQRNNKECQSLGECI